MHGGQFRSDNSRALLRRNRTSAVDYINYTHPDYANKCDDGNRTLIEKANRSETEDIELFLPQLRQVLEALPTYGTPPEPSLIYDNVYVGTTSNADNLALLRRLNIEYLLNLAGVPVLRPDRELRHYKNPESPVVGYEEMNIEEGELYDISQHFLKAHTFVDHARKRGRVLVFCPNVDRSGAICISYLVRKGYSLLQATKLLKNKRKSTLFNPGFMKRLIVFARDRGLLDKSMPHHGAVQFEGLTRVRDRPTLSHYLSIC